MSIVTALTKVVMDIYESVDNKKVSLLTLCGLSKAFDTVSHSIFIKKLYNIGIDSFWFKDYLAHRTQSVGVGEDISTKLEVSFGVPQRSILVPI